MADNFGLKIGLEGEKEFKKALSEINQSFKSVSRFSRDVKKFEKIMRILKKCGVGVFFELENLYSLDAEAAIRFDLILAI